MALSKINIKAILLLFMFILSCGNRDSKTEIAGLNSVDRLSQRKLRVVTDYNSTNYFVYKGQPMGFQYEMLCELSDYLGIELEVTVNNNLEEKFDAIKNNELDLIAMNLTVTEDRKNFLDFTVAHSSTHQVLVQQIPDAWVGSYKTAPDSVLVREPQQLEGKTVYVQKNSSHASYLNTLAEENGIQINIKEVNVSVEKLIAWVADGKIDYTVCDENVGDVNYGYFNNIDTKTAIGPDEKLAWAVRKGNRALLVEIDAWLNEFTKSRRFAIIYNKYFKSDRQLRIRESDYFSMVTGKVSEYDDIIKTYANSIGWDWKLLASLIYQESRFNPNALSWAGAFGLMQFMPITAQRYGISPASSPAKQIQAGIKFIGWLERQYSDIRDPNERLKFILASYNVGPGHVKDARKLAQKYGYDPDVWENNVEEFLLSKSEPEYFTDAVVSYGYCRGTETVKYVSDILTRYEHYKNIIPN